jgi:hypothetical protein
MFRTENQIHRHPSERFVQMNGGGYGGDRYGSDRYGGLYGTI